MQEYYKNVFLLLYLNILKYQGNTNLEKMNFELEDYTIPGALWEQS